MKSVKKDRRLITWNVFHRFMDPIETNSNLISGFTLKVLAAPNDIKTHSILRVNQIKPF